MIGYASQCLYTSVYTHILQYVQVYACVCLYISADAGILLCMTLANTSFLQYMPEFFIVYLHNLAWLCFAQYVIEKSRICPYYIPSIVLRV